MRQFNYMPLGLVQVVELPLQLLLALWTSKTQHKFFIMSLFPWACNSQSVHACGFYFVKLRLLFCEIDTLQCCEACIFKTRWTVKFNAAGQRAGVTSAEDLLACVYSALGAHTWPSNGVDGYWPKHLTSVWKLISGATGCLTGTSDHPE